MTWILIVGDPSNGFTFFGPYATRRAAEKAGNTLNSTGRSWWVEYLERLS